MKLAENHYGHYATGYFPIQHSLNFLMISSSKNFVVRICEVGENTIDRCVRSFVW